MPARPIVVATDLQARSDRAIDRALMLARARSLPVVVVHVTSDNGDDSALAEALVRDVLPDPAADVEVFLPSGSAPKTIALTAQEQDAELLVAGVASYNHFRDFFLGTAVDYIVRHATMPVLVVKKRPHEAYRSIVIASDFSEPSRQAVLAAARMFLEAPIEIVHAYHVPYEGFQKGDYVREDARERNQQGLDEFLADAELAAVAAGRLGGRIGYGSLDAVVAEAVTDTDADLLVLGTHGESGFRHATIGSNANSLLASAMVDTMMVPMPR